MKLRSAINTELREHVALAVKQRQLLKIDQVLTLLRITLGERKAHLMPMNREALERGMQCVREQRA